MLNSSTQWTSFQDESPPPSGRVPTLTLHRGGDVRDEMRRNRLLAAVHDSTGTHWASLLEPVVLPQGKVLQVAGSAMNYVYFLTTATVSLVSDLENGDSAEVAIIGNEGLVGTWTLMGGRPTNLRPLVQSAGRALRMRSTDLQYEFNRGGVVTHELLRYTQALITQMSQNVACSRHHLLEQRLCRWLLLSLDRNGGNEFAMTHEFIAHMLGVRREGISEAAGHLQSKGILKCGRGHLTVLDRDRLQHLSCECYGVVKREYDRLLPAEAA